ncbi:MAG: 2-oxo acid dehydrogenase subunit E2 [Planctomycetes bacterium]|jgi:pyruvate dehydrogenase E2 component (dihydrolipoamide acetyltransferase)|nr:2-oxo acid dehydrogenase subunit E2 [Planctomycetota bacterium]
MTIDITMPRLSDTMEKGTVVKWHIAVGDEVSAGDVIADIETDKAMMEMQSFDDGVILSIDVDEGLSVDVGTVLAILAGEDDDNSVAAVDPVAVVQPSPTPSEPTLREETRAAGDQQRVTPVARRLADQYGVDVASLRGSGPSGRVIKRDVLDAAKITDEVRAAVPPSAKPAEPPAPIIEQPSLPVPATKVEVTPSPLARLENDRREPVSSMRQTIARRLVESKQDIPHYQVSMVFAMDAMMNLRKQLNAELADQGVKLSVNDLIVRACAVAMHRNPLMNASWDRDAIVYHGDVNIGIAVALPEERGGGLVVPVIHSANTKSLRVISSETRMLSEKARTRGLSMDEMDGATFTISNLGMFGVDAFTAIINPPNSAILAVGASIQKPVVRDGELGIGWEMNATLSNDHRVVDGATAARYLATLKELIEHPAAILV